MDMSMDMDMDMDTVCAAPAWGVHDIFGDFSGGAMSDWHARVCPRGCGVSAPS